MRIAAIIGVVLFHLIALQIFAWNVLRMPMPESISAITWLNLAPPAKTKRAPETERSPNESKQSDKTEPVWAMRPVESDSEAPPDFAGLGRMLNACRLENLSYLSKGEQKRCGLLMLGLPHHSSDIALSPPSQTREPERWAREQAKRKAPAQLPCFGDKGFNPFGDGCLSNSGQ